MKNSDYLLKSFLSAAGVFMYISLVAWFLFNGKGVFGEIESFLLPVMMLLLFVISACITGLLVLGKPIHLYLNGNKREAITLLVATLVWLILFLAAVVAVLLLG